MARLTIGEFSQMTHLSVRTLRRYHEAGLLEPAEVDEWSSYRYYDPAQIPAAQMIRRLRELDVPVREIRELLTATEVLRHELLARHLARLEEQLARTRDAVSSLRRLLSAGDDLDVVRRSVPAQLVAAVRERVGSEDVLGWYSAAMAELDEALAASGAVPTGPAGGLYANELYEDGAGELVVFLPVARPVARGRVTSFEVPAADVVTTVHTGDFADLDVTYGRLGQWVAAHGLGIAGAVRETYVVGPRDTPDEARWRTEIGWPVRPSD